MTTIPEGLSAISTALGIVKTIREIDKGVQEADYKLQIANITSALADAKMALVDAQDELREKSVDLEKLRAAAKFLAEETILESGFLFRRVNDKPAGRPFCSVCRDSGSFIHLNQIYTKDGESYSCPKCKGNFGWNVPRFAE